MAREYFLTGSDQLATGLTAGSRSEWFPVSQNVNHSFYLVISGISTSINFRFKCCPMIDGEPGTDFEAVFSDDITSIVETSDGTYKYFFNGVRTGFVLLDFESAIGGTPTIDLYYYGGR